MPEFDLPEGYTDKDQYLRFLTYKGAEERWGTMTKDQTDRLDFELEMVAKMGFPGYFLIVQDFLRAAREMGVSVWPRKRISCRICSCVLPENHRYRSNKIRTAIRTIFESRPYFNA